MVDLLVDFFNEFANVDLEIGTGRFELVGQVRIQSEQGQSFAIGGGKRRIYVEACMGDPCLHRGSRAGSSAAEVQARMNELDEQIIRNLEYGAPAYAVFAWVQDGINDRLDEASKNDLAIAMLVIFEA
jgi:hypothetical protein